MKYFFLSEGWTTGRIWEFGGLWDEFAWQRKPHLKKMPICTVENGAKLWLFQVEEAVLMVEVRPLTQSSQTIGQVVLKRLITADQALEHLCSADSIINTADSNGVSAPHAFEPNQLEADC